MGLAASDGAFFALVDVSKAIEGSKQFEESDGTALKNDAGAAHHE